MRITVIVSSFNKGKYIDKMLTSLDKQTSNNFKTIIIDDNSTDNSMDKILDFQDNTSKDVEVYQNTTGENKGVSFIRNLGVEYADTDYITFLDADDYLDKHFIENAEKVISKNRATDIIRGRVIPIVDGKVKANGKLKGYSQFKDTIIKPSSNREYFVREISSANGRLYHISLFGDIKFEESNFEDYEFSLESMINCNKLVYTNSLKYYYQMNKDGRYSYQKRNFAGNCLDYLEIHERINNKGLMMLDGNAFLKESLRIRKVRTCFDYLKNVAESKMSDADKKEFITLYLTYLKNYDELDYSIYNYNKNILGRALDYVDDIDQISKTNDFENIKIKIKEIASKY